MVAEHVRTGYMSLGRITDQLKTKAAPRISSILKDLYVFSMGQECPTDLVLQIHITFKAYQVMHEEVALN